jgi:hypothetical protein
LRSRIGDALIDTGERDRAASFYQAAAFLPDASLRLAALAWLRGDAVTRRLLFATRAPAETQFDAVPTSLGSAWEQCFNALEQADNAAKPPGEKAPASP